MYPLMYGSPSEVRENSSADSVSRQTKTRFVGARPWGVSSVGAHRSAV
ncbi:MAG: hypothetical protein R2716_08910 [Microthrixaceae bacterium]